MKNPLTKMSNSLHNLTVYSLKNKVPEFEKAKEYLIALSEKLIMIEKISNRVNKERLGNFYIITYALSLNYYSFFRLCCRTE